MIKNELPVAKMLVVGDMFYAEGRMALTLLQFGGALDSKEDIVFAGLGKISSMYLQPWTFFVRELPKEIVKDPSVK